MTFASNVKVKTKPKPKQKKTPKRNQLNVVEQPGIAKAEQSRDKCRTLTRCMFSADTELKPHHDRTTVCTEPSQFAESI